MEMRNAHNLPQKVQDVYAPFLKQMIDLHGANLSSVFIYGSATGKNFLPKSSDINSVMVVKKITLETLDKGLKPIAAVKGKRIAAPLILTEEHIRSSLDVFSIEFLDMKETAVVVYGNDFLKDIEIQGEHVRLFCEQQIKGKLIRIRQAYLEVGLKRRGVEMLMRESLGALIPVFRSVIRLKGRPAPVDKEEVIRQVGEIFGVKTEVMTAIWREKKNDERVAGRDAREAFGEYIQVLEQLAGAVDRL